VQRDLPNRQWHDEQDTTCGRIMHAISATLH
jgi:hypothetical protein